MPASKYTLKAQLTEQILKQFPTLDWKLDKAIRTWWANPNGGWKLSYAGYRCFHLLDIQAYEFDIEKLTPALVVKADRVLTSPYYINMRDKVLLLYSGREATALKMTGVDFREYLEHYC
jgi:hypothetical protein